MAPIETEFLNDTFVPAPFQNTKEIAWLHHRRRFGHTNNITTLTSLTSSTEDGGKDYLMGAIASAVMIFVVFAVWSIVLAVLKCLGKKRAGCLSGAIPPLPPPPADEKGRTPSLSASKAGTREEGSPTTGDSQKEEDSAIGDHIATDVREDETAGLGTTAVRSESGEMSRVRIEPQEAGSSLSASDSATDSHTTGPMNENLSKNVVDEEAITPPCGDARTVDGIFPSQLGRDSLDIEDAMNCDRSDPEYILWKKKVESVRKRILLTRVLVLICGVGIILFTIFFIVYGVHSLLGSLNSVEDSLDKTVDTASQALSVTEEYISAENRTRREFLYFTERFDGWCNNSVQNEEIAEIEALAEEATAMIVEAKDNMLGQALELGGDLKELITTADSLKAQISKFEWAAYVAAAFAAILGVVVIMLMTNVVLVWTKRMSPPFKCLHSYFFYPLFLGLLVLCWIFATIFILGSLVAADFCYNSPDKRIARIVNKYFKDNFSSLVFSFIGYYISGCQDDLRPVQIDSLIWEMLEVLYHVHRLINRLSTVPETTLVSACQIYDGNATAVTDACYLLDDQMHLYLRLLQEVRQVFFCENFNPIYTGLTHDALCYNGTTALAWCFWSQLAIAILCMIIVTARAAWDDVHIAEAETTIAEAEPAKGYETAGSMAFGTPCPPPETSGSLAFGTPPPPEGCTDELGEKDASEHEKDGDQKLLRTSTKVGVESAE